MSKTEIELKYQIPSAEVRDRLLAEPLWSDGAWTETEMRSVYYDTSTGALTEAGISLRFRLENGEGVANAKIRTEGAVAGAFSRQEYEVPAETPSQGFALLAQEPALSPYLTDVSLGETVRLAFLRKEKKLRFRGAELNICIDEGWLGREENRFMELEAELMSGEPSALSLLSDWLRERYGLTPSVGGKLSRAKAYMNIQPLCEALQINS